MAKNLPPRHLDVAGRLCRRRPTIDV
jgi:hypothetical protein